MFALVGVGGCRLGKLIGLDRCVGEWQQVEAHVGALMTLGSSTSPAALRLIRDVKVSAK